MAVRRGTGCSHQAGGCGPRTVPLWRWLLQEGEETLLCSACRTCGEGHGFKGWLLVVLFLAAVQSQAAKANTALPSFWQLT